LSVPPCFWLATALFAFPPGPPPLDADKVESTLTFAGRYVMGRVIQDKGGPAAAEVPLRLRDSSKRIIAVVRTDSDGNWLFPLERTGKYEVEIVCGDDVIPMPFPWTAPPPEQTPAVVMLPCCQAAAAAARTPRPLAPDEIPLETIALGVGCLAAAGTMLFLCRLGVPA
jgi:hypothetical protein